ncbi:Zonula occludens toxin [Pseudomonas aeruginosa]|nr:Zonula occludens toxin [Pseudomonas aeruginosa]
MYVIDECHLSIPLRGTPVPVEEWYSLHRHELADVLLITQSYGKINRAIRDLVQVVYRCKKATAFGTNDRYIRKVQDGLRGEVVNTSIREYQKQFYGFWKSHTRSSAAGQELAANDIVPIWKRWPFKGAALCFLIVICLSTWNVTREKKHAPPPRVQPVAVSVDSASVEAAPAAPVIEAKPRGPEQKLHPFQGLSMHLIATMRGKRFRDGVEEEFLGGFIQLANNGAAGQ